MFKFLKELFTPIPPYTNERYYIKESLSGGKIFYEVWLYYFRFICIDFPSISEDKVVKIYEDESEAKAHVERMNKAIEEQAKCKSTTG